jgi:CBS domain-containing protein
MQVKDIMTERVKTAHPGDSVQDVAAKMRDFDVGMVPIIQDDKVIGVVTDRDISIRAIAEGKDAAGVKAGDIMTPEVCYCYEDDSLAEVGRVMGKNQVRRLLVLNHDKGLAGVCSLGNLANHDKNNELSAAVLKKVSQPGK